MSLLLLQCIGKAVIKHAVRHLMKCLPFGELLYDIAHDTLLEWKLSCGSAVVRRVELEALAQADLATVRQEALAVASSVAPPELQTPLAEYLQRVPGVIRRSLSRPDDPSGRTAPAGLPLDKPEDLAPFLPLRPSRFRPGDRPGGLERWALRELLGVGGFGEVWLAEDHAGSEAALKFCLDPVAGQALRNERELLQRIQKNKTGRHGFVRLLQSHLDADPPCLVYEYVPGGDLTRLIRCWHESRPSPERLVWESVRLIRDLARTLTDAHQLTPPIVHRDLKPSNILLQPSGPNKVKLRVADFGIGGIAVQQAMTNLATCSAKEALTTSMRGAHTPLYASPQQKEGRSVSDPRDDIYALGVIGYQTLTGDTTTSPPTWMRSELCDRQVPDCVCDFLESCLMEDVEDRPADAGSLVETLEDLFAQLPQPRGARSPA